MVRGFESERYCWFGTIFCLGIIACGFFVLFSAFGTGYMLGEPTKRAYLMYTNTDQGTVHNFSELTVAQKKEFLSMYQNGMVKSISDLNTVSDSNGESIAVRYKDNIMIVRANPFGYIESEIQFWISLVLFVIGGCGLVWFDERRHQIKLKKLREQPIEYLELEDDNE